MTFSGSMMPAFTMSTYSPARQSSGTKRYQASEDLQNRMPRGPLACLEAWGKFEVGLVRGAGDMWSDESGQKEMYHYTCVPLDASKPQSRLACSLNLPITTAPSTPALLAMVRAGVYEGWGGRGQAARDWIKRNANDTSSSNHHVHPKPHRLLCNSNHNQPTQGLQCGLSTPSRIMLIVGTSIFRRLKMVYIHMRILRRVKTVINCKCIH